MCIQNVHICDCSIQEKVKDSRFANSKSCEFICTITSYVMRNQPLVMSRKEVNKGLSSYVVRANLKSLFGRQTKKHPYCMDTHFSPVSDGIRKCSIGYFPKRHLYNVCYTYIWDSLRHKKGQNILIFIHIVYQCCSVPERVLYVHKIYSDSVCSGCMFTRGCLQHEK